jgi:CheY-like chemotaxis protein
MPCVWFDLSVLMPSCQIRMAETNGITFCQEVRKDPGLASLVMIASSASVYVDDRETALAVGFNGFVPKPVNEAQLFGLFEELLWRDGSA